MSPDPDAAGEDEVPKAKGGMAAAVLAVVDRTGWEEVAKMERITYFSFQK